MPWSRRSTTGARSRRSSTGQPRTCASGPTSSTTPPTRSAIQDMNRGRWEHTNGKHQIPFTVWSIWLETGYIQYLLQGAPSGWIVGLGWLRIWLFYLLPGSAWADRKLAELTEYASKIAEHQHDNDSSMSAQPTYYRLDHLDGPTCRSNKVWV